MQKVAEDEPERDAQQVAARSWLSPDERQRSQQQDAPEHVVDLQQQRRGLIELGGDFSSAECAGQNETAGRCPRLRGKACSVA